MEVLAIGENNLNLVLEIDDDRDVKLLHFSALPFDAADISEKQKDKFRFMEIQASGYNQDDHHDLKHTGTLPAKGLKYQGRKDYRNGYGRKCEIRLEHNGLAATGHLQFYTGISVVRSWTEIENCSAENIGLEYVSSFSLTGLVKEGGEGWDKKAVIHIPHNSWFGECQWRKHSLPELGLCRVNPSGMKRLSFAGNGTWSTSQYLPMGIVTNTACGSSLFWQIENNGAWHWEVSDADDQLYLKLSGPTMNENHWWKNLQPGQTFRSVPVAVGSTRGGFDESIAELTKYRRATRRPNGDNENLPVIFNDYMNCLMGDPTTAKELPLIDAAAAAGCEYYVIDAGWHADGDWWNGVGAWLPSTRRFPGGMEMVIDYIKSKGMIPGLWIEIEVMGMDSLAKHLPDDWFFIRHGKRVLDHGRFQLDFRNAAVREYADKTVARLVHDYGIGYLKMDYNINAGIGTELNADSFGDGLLSHNQAYLAWIDGIIDRYPHLVLENCGSGGMRMDYAMLSRYSLQSVTDQTDYRKNAVIAASALSAVTPEQSAVWSYPSQDGDREEVIFNMINSLLCRVHQSGRLDRITGARFDLVREAIAYYKKNREYIRSAIPFWPLGCPAFTDPWISVGLKRENRIMLAVWRLAGGPEVCMIPLKTTGVRISCAFPQYGDGRYEWAAGSSIMRVTFPQENCARLFEIILEES